MTTVTETRVATQVYQLHINATPEAIWDALTTSTDTYGYRSKSDYELRPGGAFRVHASEEMRAMGAPEVIIDGEVLEAEAPRRLVQTWHAHFDAQTDAEGATRLNFELDQGGAGVTKLTLTHELDGAPLVASLVSGSMPNTGGGWPFVLSDLKTLLETGKPLPG